MSSDENYLQRAKRVAEEQFAAPSTDLWSADITFYAFRYALGRQTYAVAEVAAYLVRVRDRLPAHVKRMVCQEIDEAIEDGQAGSRWDVEKWQAVAVALRKDPS